MSKHMAYDSDEIDEVNLRATTEREKVFLRGFAEDLDAYDENITFAELLRGKRIALLRFRASNAGLDGIADDLARERIASDEGDEEEFEEGAGI